ncbi:MAG TPA: dihydrolipoyllysine-residue succinyltransferase, partial [Pirellulales bacterium]
GPATAAAGPTPTTGSAPPSTSDSARVMPAAQQLMSQEHLSASAVVPSGPGNRILKEDVQRAIDQRGPASNASPSLGAASSTASSNAASSPVERSQTVVRVEPRPSSITAGGGNGLPREEEYVVMSPIRRRIAERLVQAQQNAALLTTFNEVDMSEVIALRGKHRAQYEKQYGVKLGFMSFFVKAVVDALKGVPQLNAEVREPHIVYRNYYDIGIAVGGGKGLVVPVLRNAEFMSFGEIEQKIADFGRRAAENKLKLEELQGGTFTISNGGVYGSMLSTPIINPPQSGILGLHAIEDRPAVRDGQVVARPMMYVALTYDHRIVDGREAVLFLKRVKDVIEEPTRMLLEI